MIKKDARRKKMMRAREAGKNLTYANSTFHVHGSLKYAVFLAGLPRTFIAFQLSSNSGPAWQPWNCTHKGLFT